jgi:hypothetical protein
MFSELPVYRGILALSYPQNLRQQVQRLLLCASVQEEKEMVDILISVDTVTVVS